MVGTIDQEFGGQHCDGCRSQNDHPPDDPAVDVNLESKMDTHATSSSTEKKKNTWNLENIK